MLRRGCLVAAVLAAVGVSSTGAATSPLQFSRTMFHAGKVPLTEAQDYDVFMTNVGNEPLTLISAEITDDPNTYITPSGCSVGATLETGQTCLFEVNISAQEVGKINDEWCWTAQGASGTVRQCGRIVGRVIA
jgi:HYDIN/CFA65/VesB-like, Ig-like domain